MPQRTKDIPVGDMSSYLTPEVKGLKHEKKRLIVYFMYTGNEDNIKETSYEKGWFK